MKETNKIVEELISISPLIGEIEKSEIYSVPSNYFDDLSEAIVEQINHNKERAHIPESGVPYKVPAGYFNFLPDLVLQKVLSATKETDNVFEELAALAPLLNTISKKPLYSVPTGFFDNIQLPAVKPEKQETNVVSIKRRSKLARFSVAAVIIPFLAIGLYTLIVKDPSKGNNNAKSAIKNLSNEEIVTFLKNNVPIQNTTSASDQTSNRDHKIKSSLKQISDQEIYQFLKETGESDEI